MCEGGGVPAPSLLLYVCLIYVMYLCVCLAGCVYPWAVGGGVCVCVCACVAGTQACVREGLARMCLWTGRVPARLLMSCLWKTSV